MINYPKVSVVTITYGHEKYITETMDGVLMQNYPGEIELIIANDNSPDHTDEIVKNYLSQKTIPKNVIIKYTKHETNKGMMPNFIWALQQAKGKYIALCEGDDYWTDPLKLQKQVDFLEKNEGYSMVFSNAEVLIEVEETMINSSRGLVVLSESREYTDIEILENWTVPTASVMFRTNLLNNNYYEISLYEKFIYGDIILFLWLLKQGKAYGIIDYTVVYRRQEGGVTNVKKANVNFDNNYFNHLNEIINQFGKHLRTKKINEILSRLALSLALFNLNNKKIIPGFIYLTKAMNFDFKIVRNYMKSKI